MVVFSENGFVKRPGQDVPAQGSAFLCLWRLGLILVLGQMGWPAQAQLGGRVTAWGYNSKGQTLVPPSLANIISVASGYNHNLALFYDGQVAAWGHNHLGQATPPSGLSGVAAIAAGGNRSLALKNDGTVVQWGDSTYPVPPGLSGVVAIAASATHCLALSREGMVIAWGDNQFGQSEVPPYLNGVVAVAAGADFSLALKNDGRVVAWGNNDYGQQNIPSGLHDAVAIAAGSSFALALRADGSLASWGVQLGEAMPAGLSNIMAIASGPYHSLALDHGGRVTAWGWNGNGQTSVPPGLSGAVSIAAGGGHSLALLGEGPPVLFAGVTNLVVDEGCSLVIPAKAVGQSPLNYRWRRDGAVIPGATNAFLFLPAVQTNDAGSYSMTVSNATGDPALALYTVTISRRAPAIEIQPVDRTAHVGQSLDFQIQAGGSAPLNYQWSFNGDPIAGATNAVLTLTDVDVSLAGGYAVEVTNALGAATSREAGLAVVPLVALGNNRFGQATVPAEASDATALAAGFGFSLALSKTGSIVAWGDNQFGQLNVPPQATNVIAIAVLGDHSLALKEDGRVLAWGRNDFGQAKVPAGLTNIVAVAAGWEHSLALGQDGRVWAWGNNHDGQTSVPVGLLNVVAIAAGSYHSLALRGDGQVVAWGRNQLGQCDVPPNLPAASSIGAGFWQSFALHADGAVTVWGDTAGFPPDLSGVVSIAIGGANAWAVKRDGSILSWPMNAPGLPVRGDRRITLAFDIASSNNLEGFYLYLGPASRNYTRVLDLGDSTIVTLSDLVAGIDYYAVTTAYNAYGRESDPSNELLFRIPTVSTELPPALTNATVLAAGYDHFLALPGGGAPVFLTQPASRDAFVGMPLMLSALATGQGDLQFQWLFNGQVLTGAQSPALVLTDVSLSHSGNYALVAANALGAATSAVARVRVLESLPIILVQPQSRTTVLGEQAQFRTVATGNEPLFYQWLFNDEQIEGATNDVLILPAPGRAQAGSYSVTMTNGLGSRLSQSAQLAVVPVVAWGGNFQGESDVPSSLTEVTAIDGDEGYSLALQADRTVVVWGNADSDEPAPAAFSPPVSNIVAVAAGSDHTLALRGDGTLTGWDRQGTLLTNLPPELKDVVAISVHLFRNLALRSDGTVVAWAYSEEGRPFEKTRLDVPDELTNVVEIAAGGTLSAALKSDGTVAVWDADDILWDPQLDRILALTNVLALAAGDAHLLALHRDGRVSVFDGYDPGQTNALPDLTEVAAISAGWFHSLALKRDGTVVAWGDNYSGETMVPLSLSNAVAVAAGSVHSLALKSEQPLATLIQPEERTAYTGTTVFMAAPTLEPPALAYQWLNASGEITGATNSYLRLTDVGYEAAGAYSLVVSNVFGSFSNLNTLLTVTDSAPILIDQPLAKVAYGLSSSVFSVNVDGSLPLTYQWRLFGADLPGATNATLVIPQSTTGFQGEYSVVLSNAFGTLESSNVSLVVVPVAALEDLELISEPAPIQLTNAVGVALGEDYSAALRRDGSIVMWRDNAYELEPVPADVTGAVALRSGSEHTLALLSDGSVRAWGDNDFGQTDVPPDLTNAVQISAGPDHSLALRRDGQVVAWGRNFEGQGQVPSDLSNIVAISAGEFHNLALRGDGRVLAWGGEDPAVLNVPENLTDAVAIAAGHGLSLALRADGRVTAWEWSNGLVFIPLPNGLTNIMSMALGARRAWAWRRDGTALVWDLEDGDLLQMPPGLTNVTAVADGDRRTLALLGFGAPYVVCASPDRLAYTGTTAYFRAEATGQPPLFYQWQFNGIDIPGATNQVYALPDLQLEYTGEFRVVVTNPAGQTVGPPHLFTVVESPPLLLRPLADQSARLHERVVFRASADGSNPLSYQWSYEGTPLSGQTNPVLDLDRLSLAHQGRYSVLMSNALGDLSATNTLLVRQVVAWSEEGPVQSEIPPDLTNAVVAASGWNHGLALRVDGTLSVWGTYGEGVPAILPPDVKNVAAIAAGAHHDLALLQDGQVVAWGENSAGQASVPPALGPAQAVAAGAYHSLILARDGSLAAWGDNRLGQIDVPPHFVHAVAIAAGDYHNLIVDDHGRVAGWGDNQFGQLTIPASATNVVAVAAGGLHSLALRANGTVVAWGNNDYGQATVPSNLINVVAISAGGTLSGALLKNNTVVVWGNVGSENLGILKGLQQATGLALGKTRHLVLLGEGSPQIYLQPEGGVVYQGSTVRWHVAATGLGPLRYLWYRDDVPLSGETSPYLILPEVQVADSGVYRVEIDGPLGLTASQPAPLQVLEGAPFLLSPPRTQSVLVGEPAILRLAVDGSRPFSYQWFYDQTPIPGATNADLVLDGVVGSKAGEYSAQISNPMGAFTSPSMTLRSQQLIAWGRNDHGQNNVPDLLDAPIAIACGRNHNLILTKSGKVTGWGDNSSGQCDPPADLDRVVAVAAGSRHNLALLEDGRVAAWGADQPNPEGWPDSLSNIVEVAAGADLSLALRADGTVLAWGNLTSPPAGLSQVVAIAAGMGHVLALKADGTVVAWGQNDCGQASVPQYLANVVAIAAGDTHSLALLSDGTVVAWGCNDAGQLNIPFNLDNVIALSAGRTHSLALRANGTLVTWGGGTNEAATLPSILASFSALNVFAIASGGDHNLALVGNPAMQFSKFTISQLSQTNLAFSLSLPTRRGRHYRLEFTETLAQGVWQMLPPAPGDNQPKTLVDPYAATPRRFYRVRLVPGNEGFNASALNPSRFGMEADRFSIEIPTALGAFYFLQYKNSLNDPKWISLPMVAGRGGMMTLEDEAADTPRRFYRVREW